MKRLPEKWVVVKERSVDYTFFLTGRLYGFGFSIAHFLGSDAMMREYRLGAMYALGCYVIWGLFPIYWSPLHQVAMPAAQILAQRVLWSAVFSVGLLCVFRQQRGLMAVFRQPKRLLICGVSAMLLAMNWLIYLWAIMNQHILEASLGYYINPLFNVLLGCLVFREQMGRWQWCAVALATVGVLWLVVLVGHVPWVALGLAMSFGLYGLMRKWVLMDALTGLTLETVLLLPFALGYWWCYREEWVFGTLSPLPLAVLCGSGVVTTIPLLCFAAGAKRIPLSHLGILQYVSPTLQMMCGLWLFGETLDRQRFGAYVWVWLGVAVFVYGVLKSSSKATDS